MAYLLSVLQINLESSNDNYRLGMASTQDGYIKASALGLSHPVYAADDGSDPCFRSRALFFACHEGYQWNEKKVRDNFDRIESLVQGRK